MRTQCALRLLGPRLAAPQLITLTRAVRLPPCSLAVDYVVRSDQLDEELPGLFKEINRRRPAGARGCRERARGGLLRRHLASPRVPARLSQAVTRPPRHPPCRPAAACAARPAAPVQPRAGLQGAAPGRGGGRGSGDHELRVWRAAVCHASWRAVLRHRQLLRHGPPPALPGAAQQLPGSRPGPAAGRRRARLGRQARRQTGRPPSGVSPAAAARAAGLPPLCQ